MKNENATKYLGKKRKSSKCQLVLSLQAARSKQAEGKEKRMHINASLDETLRQIKSLSLSVLTAIIPREPGLAGPTEANDDKDSSDNWS